MSNDTEIRLPYFVCNICKGTGHLEGFVIPELDGPCHTCDTKGIVYWEDHHNEFKKLAKEAAYELIKAKLLSEYKRTKSASILNPTPDEAYLAGIVGIDLRDIAREIIKDSQGH